MKKRVIIILLILLALALLVWGGMALYKNHCATTDTPVESEDEAIEMESVEVEIPQEETHGMIKFQDIEFDDRMLGKWQHVIDTGWYRVYTMEPAGDDYYWGREWNTSDDIFEEDLNPYGNGWFKWKKEGDNVMELHMTDNQSASIPYQYQMQRLNNQEMRYKETSDNERQVFSKCPEW